MATPLPERFASELATVEGVASVDTISFLPGRAGGESVLILPRTFAATAAPPLDLREGSYVFTDSDGKTRNGHQMPVSDTVICRGEVLKNEA